MSKPVHRHGRGRRSSLHLFGRQDSLGSWVRQGRRLARALFEILERAGQSILEGDASVHLGTRKGHFRLTDEVITMIRGGASAGIGWDEADEWSRQALWRSLDQGSARSGQFTIRRLPELEVCKDGLILPDLSIQSRSARALLCVVGSEQQAGRLADTMKHAPASERFIFAGSRANLAPLEQIGASLIAEERCEAKSLTAGIMAALDRLPGRNSERKTA